jgi:hypothetical protein
MEIDVEVLDQSKCNSFPTGKSNQSYDNTHVRQIPSQIACFQKDFKLFTDYFSLCILKINKVNQDLYNFQQSFFIMFSNKILRLVGHSNSNHGPVEER